MACIWVVLCALLYVCQLATCQQKVRLCLWSAPAKAKCDALGRAFASADLGQLTCVQATSQYECMSRIATGKADIAKIDATNLFAAENVFGLTAILKEAKSTSPNDEGYLYKAVVIVRSDSSVTSLDDLYMKKSCHTGVGRTVGWTVPVSNLQARGVIPVLDCDNTVFNVANFFSESCAPGAFEEENNVNNDNPANVCTVCESRECPASDKYAGYKGAVQCLIDSRGDVAFAKHSTVNDLITSGMSINKENFRLLCPDGNLKHVDEWGSCFWATRPTDVIVASSKQSSEAISGIRSMLSEGSIKFRNDSATFNMFSSAGYNDTNVLFTDNMKQLLGVTSSKANPYLDQGYMRTMLNYTACNTTDRWCVVSDVEMDKCRQMSAAFSAARITNRISCVRAQSHKECMEKIEKEAADLVTLDGGDVYTGGKYHKLVPIMAESYGQTGTTSYWAVAVVKKSNTGVTMRNLKGKTSCHTGIGKTSGWNIPVGTLIENGDIKADSQCGIVQGVSKFFSKSCVPGALDPKYDPTGQNPANLCELCGGKNSCKRDKSNKYYGYTGAFRCLVETNADVAFVKHSTVFSNTDGKLQENWARNLKSSDFELLCPDGSRADVTSWQSCNLAQVPSHVVVTSGSKTRLERRHYATILKKGQFKFGTSSKGFKMFSSDALFDHSTSSLADIMDDRQDYRKWLGDAYTKIIAAIDKKACTSAASCIVNSMCVLVMSLIFSFSHC